MKITSIQSQTPQFGFFLFWSISLYQFLFFYPEEQEGHEGF